MSAFRNPIGIRKFGTDRSANVAMVFALSALVLVGLTGMGIDYYTALSAKAQLDMAADAASIGAINAIKNYMQANPTLSATTAFANATPLAQSQAQEIFTVNAGKNGKITSAPTVAMTRSGQTITATVAYTGASPAAFGPLVAVHNININGTSAASLKLPAYIDFYLLLDVSGSMGLPSDSSGQTQLASLNPDNNNQNPADGKSNFCAFACHFTQNMCTTVQSEKTNQPNVACQGYSLAASNGITLRAAAVGTAVQAVLTTAQTTETGNNLSNQFRVGLYPFIVNMGVFQPLSTNLSAESTAISNLGGGNGQGLANLLDVGTSANNAMNLGSGGTQIDNALTTINTTITSVGDGSSTQSTQPFVFLVTDGAQNFQYYTSSSNSWNSTFYPPYPSQINGGGTSTPYVFDTTSPTSANWPSLCTTLKNRGITISILYLPYVPIKPASTFAGWEDYKVNWVIPSPDLTMSPPMSTIPQILQACASPGFFFTANSAADITTAMQAMFAQSVASAHLTH